MAIYTMLDTLENLFVGSTMAEVKACHRFEELRWLGYANPEGVWGYWLSIRGLLIKADFDANEVCTSVTTPFYKWWK